MTYTDGQYNGGAVPANTGSEQRMGYSALRIGASPPTYSTIDSTIKNGGRCGKRCSMAFIIPLLSRILILTQRAFLLKPTVVAIDGQQLRRLYDTSTTQAAIHLVSEAEGMLLF
jgi:hypothetical protein